jgi:flagellar hook-length control protein FliK
VDVPALTGAGKTSGGVEGKVESVQDGKAMVKLVGGAQVQVAVDRELPAGTSVTVAAASDGTLQLTVRTPDAQLAKMRDAIWQTLQSLVGETLATELSVPLSKGDFAAAARSLPVAASTSQASSAVQTDAGIAESAIAGPIFLSDRSSPVPPRGDAVLAILAQVERNVYDAEFAGQSQKLLGPTGVEPSTRLLARAQPLPGGGGIWTPTPVLATAQRGLGDRIQAGQDGARELLHWAGASDANSAEVEELGRALADAANALLDEVHPEMTESVTNGPSTTEALPGRTSDRPATADRTPPAGTGSATATDPPRAVPANPGGSTEIVVPAQARSASTAGILPTAEPVAGNAEKSPPSTFAARTPASESATGVATASTSAQSGDQGVRSTGPSAAQLPTEAAVRVLVAWSLGLPKTPAVQRALLGQTAQDLPQTLASLEKVVQRNPGRHPALEAALRTVSDAGRLPSPSLSDAPRRNLESAVLDALVRESADDGDAEPLRKAAESLLADRLPGRTAAEQAGQTYWAGQTGDWEKARIVVRDERQRKGKGGDGQAPSDVHAVDIGMDPKGLGRVDAHLELRGQILTTRLEAEDPATADLLRARLSELSEALAKLGLESGGVDVRRKAPVQAPAPRRRGAGGALDVRA